jgi:hypothetical protein
MNNVDVLIEIYNERQTKDNILKAEYNSHNLQKTDLISYNHRLQEELKQLQIDRKFSEDYKLGMDTERKLNKDLLGVQMTESFYEQFTDRTRTKLQDVQLIVGTAKRKRSWEDNKNNKLPESVFKLIDLDLQRPIDMYTFEHMRQQHQLMHSMTLISRIQQEGIRTKFN